MKTNNLKVLLVLSTLTTLNAENYSLEDIMLSYGNVCDLNRIYNESYKYSMPKDVLESYLSGKAFDNPDFYTSEESQRLQNDINTLYQSILEKNPDRESIAIMTAGGPGAGKTTKLLQDRKDKALKGKNYAYICPDDVCLKNQTTTYVLDVENSDKSITSRTAAYNKWRPGSNAATHLILGNLIREKFAFYFGTTSTSPATGKFFDFLKKQGYKIKLIHITAPDDTRWNSITERDKTFVQTTEEDVREKGLLLPQRISDTFLKYADEIHFHYRDQVKEDAHLAATWIRNEENLGALGTLHITSQALYENIKSVHNATVNTLNRPELLWEETVEKNSAIKN